MWIKFFNGLLFIIGLCCIRLAGLLNFGTFFFCFFVCVYWYCGPLHANVPYRFDLTQIFVFLVASHANIINGFDTQIYANFTLLFFFYLILRQSMNPISWKTCCWCDYPKYSNWIARMVSKWIIIRGSN